jgi:para-nitrobenzyl esterase
MMFGLTENEMRSGAAAFFPMPEEDYDFFMSDTFGDNVSVVEALYPPAAFSDPFYAFVNAVDDSGAFGTGCHLYDVASQFAAHVPTYVYRFDDSTAPNPTWVIAADGFVAGASHGSDEPYWFDRPFDTLPALTEAQADLASQMVQHLGEFLKDGTPAGRHTPRWPEYDARRQRSMRFVTGGSEITRSLPIEDNCAFQNALGF